MIAAPSPYASSMYAPRTPQPCFYSLAHTSSIPKLALSRASRVLPHSERRFLAMDFARLELAWSWTESSVRERSDRDFAWRASARARAGAFPAILRSDMPPTAVRHVQGPFRDMVVVRHSCNASGCMLAPSADMGTKGPPAFSPEWEGHRQSGPDIA